MRLVFLFFQRSAWCLSARLHLYMSREHTLHDEFLVTLFFIETAVVSRNTNAIMIIDDAMIVATHNPATIPSETMFAITTASSGSVSLRASSLGSSPRAASLASD